MCGPFPNSRTRSLLAHCTGNQGAGGLGGRTKAMRVLDRLIWWCDAGAMQPLTDNLADDAAQPYFIWNEPITISELRRLLQHSDHDVRALWMARIMREARYQDVWRFVELKDIVALFERLRRHLGRSLPMWEFLLSGWRRDGLL